jgi:signal transduction histidine kinase
MNKKLTGLFLLLTLIPVGLLILLGRVGISAEEARSKIRNAALCRDRLEIEKRKIRDLFSSIEKDLLSYRDTAGIEDARLKMRKDPLLRQIFAIDAGGETVYPSENVPLSESERDFLARTKDLGISPGLFQKGVEESAGTAPDFGWYAWYLVDGTNFIFWMKVPAENTFVPGGIIGTELNRMAVLSRTVGVLPDTPVQGEGAFRAVLADLGDKVLYQWGAYTPGEGETAVVSLSLGAPVSSWTLRYFVDPETLVLPGSSVFPIGASVALVALAVVGLSLYLYRESTREIRDAMEKVSFVNQVSHELKTPLTNIRLYADLLEGTLNEDNGKARSYLGVISSESGRLGRLIGNVLTFAKDRKHGTVFNPTPGFPEDHIRSAVENFLPSLEAKSIRLELDLLCPERAVFDADILEQIVNNLVSNGEKYAAAGKFIGVSLCRKEDDLVLTVRDLGPGIPSRLRERVFRPFYRISSRLTDGVTGAGIGLSIVRTLARRHGGDVRILPSERGAVFEVVLRAPAAEREVPGEQEKA